MKVSIITVVLNNQDYIVDAIKSVKSQSYQDIEHIVVDGGSTDGTVAKIKKHESFITKWISEADGGIYDAMNKGIAMTSGEVIGFLNADDMFYDHHVIERVASAFSPDVDCVYGNLVYVNRFNINKITRRWISGDFKDGLFEKNWSPPHPTFYCRKSIYDRYDKYRLDFIISSDTELMYRFLQNYRIRSQFIDQYLVKMRQAGISTRGIKSTFIIIREMRKAIKENGGNFNLPKYLFYKLLKVRQILFKRRK